jgi:hypothetical protein
MSSGDEERLIHLAEAITDEVPIDWDAQAREHPGLSRRLPGLRLITRIADVFNAPLPGVRPAAPEGFIWGHLEIRGILGEGGYGTVFRAHDPRLQRDVALKLLRSDLVGNRLRARRIVTEARLMARVRHRNVLTIHGADEHDGRVGFWMDLLEGETLEQRLAAGEILGSAEAALCGRELCRALGAVHGAGLVHGDVKAANVMRDREGRLVLMDFGAGSEFTADSPDSGLPCGTPLALAPELLDGGAPGPAGDLYALGVLLYRLVAGRYPLQADTLAELRRRHADVGPTPLLDLRPDLPADFVAAVERALSPDPARRFRSAGDLERALAASLGEGRSPADGRRRRRWLAAAATAMVAAVVLFLLFVLPQLRPDARARGPMIAAPMSSVAAAPMTATASFQRTGGEVPEALAEGALVRPGDTLGLTLRLGAAAHVYVLNEDRQGEVFVLFPLAETDLRNPLPAGRALHLPGEWRGSALDWRVTGGRGEERFLVVAARAPLDWLESQLAGFGAPVRDRAVDRAPPGSGVAGTERGVGAVAETADRDVSSASVLGAIVARLEGEPAASGVWSYQLMLYNLGR